MKIKKNTMIFPFLLFLLFGSCSDRITNTPDKNITAVPVVLKKTMIYSPSEGVFWKLGSVQKISWHLPENVEFVKIELFRKTELKLLINDKHPNNGNYDWLIPEVLPGSVHYRIRITAYGRPDLSTISDYFSIK